MSKKKDRPGGPATSFPVTITRPVGLPHGEACAVLSEGGDLLSVEWEGSASTLARVLSRKFPGARFVDPVKSAGGRILLAYSAGRVVSKKAILEISIDWGRVGWFASSVLKETIRVPYGETATYGEIAARVGNAAAARAVGSALARNPWPVIVPCHRVVGAGGRLTGFGKGLEAKESLLRFEAKHSPGAGA